MRGEATIFLYRGAPCAALTLKREIKRERTTKWRRRRLTDAALTRTHTRQRVRERRAHSSDVLVAAALHPIEKGEAACWL